MSASAPAFLRYVGIDYSGAETPNASLKGLRVYAADREARGQVLPLDDRDGQGVAAIGVAHQPIDHGGGSGCRWVGGKRQDLTP